jgi:hypothetical protein
MSSLFFYTPYRQILDCNGGIPPFDISHAKWLTEAESNKGRPHHLRVKP